jgi:hypothetical protein
MDCALVLKREEESTIFPTVLTVNTDYFLNGINLCVFVTETQCSYSDVRNEFM